MNRPNFLTDKHLGFLENLNTSQLNDMLYTVPYLLQNCPELNAKQAQEAVIFWLNRTTSWFQPELSEILN